MTIKQIEGATQAHPDAEHKIDGTEVTHISIVGQVRNVSNLTALKTFLLDDGTAEAEVRMWLDKESMIDSETGESAEQEQDSLLRPAHLDVAPNSYAKVVGKLTHFRGRRNISAHTVRPLTGMNEYHHHLIEATAVHLYFTQGPPPNRAGNAAAGGATGETTGAATGRSLPGLSPNSQSVLTLLTNSPTTNEGMHIQDMASALGMSTADIARACDELTATSLIFPTIDEETFAILEV